MGIWKVGVWELIVRGGPVVIPIYICSLIALAIIIEKFLYFNSLTINAAHFTHRIQESLKHNKVKEAISICSASPSPVAKVLKAGLLNHGRSKEVIREAMEDAAKLEIPYLEKRLSVLSTISNVAPLLGLLGTVTGMTGSFHTIQVQSAGANPITPGDLAGGIWEALLSTVAGLIVAIPSFIAYNYFVSRVHSIIVDMERSASEVLNTMTESGVVLTKHED